MPDEQQKRVKLSPIEIVDRYRPLYRNKYMTSTLEGNNLSPFKVPLYSNDIDTFNNSYIVIDYSVPPSREIWAANTVTKVNGIYLATVHVDPEIELQSPAVKKHIFAHEWLEVMYCMHNDKRITGKRIEKNDEAITTLYILDKLKRRGVWQDKPKDVDLLFPALRKLLVSHESIEELLKTDFDMDLAEFKKRLQEETRLQEEESRKPSFYTRVCLRFALKWSVYPDLVYDRLDELVYDDE